MEECLKAWIMKNGRGPAKILIYRDGVSEGQYKKVRDEELGRIREACKEIYGANALPQITIVVVGKRHHTRFYPTKAVNADYRGNPKNGTVVDRGVTMERGCKYLCFPTLFRAMSRVAGMVPLICVMALHKSLQPLTVTTSAYYTPDDLFLQAHSAIQGTANPSHYVVILDEMKLAAEELQSITHHLCVHVSCFPISDISENYA